MLIAAFFASNQVMIMAIITIISWMGALLAAKFLRAFLIKGESTPFIMELPPYRVPTIKGICIHTWERTWQYVKKAGTIILGISILLWAMMTFPGLPDSKTQLFEQQRQHILAEFSTFGANQTAKADDESRLSENADILKDRLAAIDAKEAEEALRNSFAGRIGRGLEGISKFMGFDWRTNIALVGGFAAKEVVVSTLGTAYSLGEVDTAETASLSEKLAAAPEWTPLTAFSLIIFMIFYAPCFVTIVAIVRESGSWKWGLFSMTFNTFIAFVFATAVFQLGTFLGL
jgi:ferrous iron transport protein B